MTAPPAVRRRAAAAVPQAPRVRRRAAEAADPELPDTRARLLEAGAEIFLRRGFDASSLDEVRRAAAVSNGSLYHHFPSKAHLARALYLDALARYQHDALAALAGDPEAGDGVRALVARHVTWVQRQPRLARVLGELRAATRIDGEWPDWEAINAAAFARLREWIAREVAAGRMLEMPFSLWLALVLAPSMSLTAGWAGDDRDGTRASIPLRTRELLADAAARAVTPARRRAPTAKTSQGARTSRRQR